MVICQCCMGELPIFLQAYMYRLRVSLLFLKVDLFIFFICEVFPKLLCGLGVIVRLNLIEDLNTEVRAPSCDKLAGWNILRRLIFRGIILISGFLG